MWFTAKRPRQLVPPTLPDADQLVLPSVEMPPLDDKIHSQQYWKRRRQYLSSLYTWVKNELDIAHIQERKTTEAPATPPFRRQKADPS